MIAGITVIAPEIDYLALYHYYKNDPLDLQKYTEREKKILIIQANIARKTVLESTIRNAEEEIEYNMIHACEGCISDLRDKNRPMTVVLSLKHAIQQFQTTQDFTLNPVIYDTYTDLSFFMEITNPKAFNTEEWETLQRMKDYARILPIEFTAIDQPDEYFYSSEFYECLEHAMKTIDDSEEIRDGDTIVGVGNTPQYILEALRHCRKQFNFISIAMSGWPGEFAMPHKPEEVLSSKFKAIATPQGLKNYCQYIKDTGLDPSHKFQRVFFMDLFSSARGPEFIVHRFIESYNPELIPDIRYISLYESRDADRTRLGQTEIDKFRGTTLEVKRIPIFLGARFINKVDWIDDNYRVLPDFKAMRWHDWHVDLDTYKNTRESSKIITGIHRHFEHYLY
jgi:hypothetical protein